MVKTVDFLSDTLAKIFRGGHTPICVTFTGCFDFAYLRRPRIERRSRI